MFIVQSFEETKTTEFGDKNLMRGYGESFFGRFNMEKSTFHSPLQRSSRMTTTRSAWVCFPTAPYTHDSAVRAARSVLEDKAGWKVIAPERSTVVSEDDVPKSGVDVYFADYDYLPFEDIHPSSSSSSSLLSSSTPSSAYPQLSSYVIRKSLIRKNYLAHSLHLARVKGSHPSHDVNRVPLPQQRAREASDDNVNRITPHTWTFEATYAEDLDELLADDLYDVRLALEQNGEVEDSKERKWFIVKPAMADQGMGIRLFDTVESLEAIFEEFEGDDDDDDEEAPNGLVGSSTAVVTSQVRQFVIQEYLTPPLLVRPPSLSSLHKFHIRAYAVAQGCLRVFLYDDMLALFAPSPYDAPSQEAVDLSSHLTNTSRQDDEQSLRTVHLLSDIQGCSTNNKNDKVLTKEDLHAIRTGAAGVIAETFVACTKAGRIHFQPWPNAWEIFGFDLMVTVEEGQADPLRVWLLEVNAQPDFAKSGDGLRSKIDKLFERTLDICALGNDGCSSEPDGTRSPWQAGESRDGMTLCLDMRLHAEGW